MFSFEEIGEHLAARITGPMHARLFLQPLMAIILGIRDGIADAKAGSPPFLWGLVVRRVTRYKRLKSAFVRMLIPILIAIVLDLIVQFMLFVHVRPDGAILFGILLMGIPYSVARSLTNRIVTFRIAKHGVATSGGR